MYENFDQLKMLTRSWLQGAGMHEALRAVNLGLDWHTGTRKDGTTPEFTHQLSQIQHVRTLNGVVDLEAVICTIALHDLPEDKPYDLKWVFAEFGQQQGVSVDRMSKKRFGKNADKSPEYYYFELAFDQDASIAKGCDRVHNQASMPFVFSVAKMTEFMGETEQFVLPMLKQARKYFPQQEPAYTSLRHRLKEQIWLIKSCLQIGGEQMLPIAL